MNTATLAPVASFAWRALGTYVHLHLDGCAAPDAAARVAADLLDQVEDACSRFRPHSDLCRANQAAGQWVSVSPLLLGAVAVAVEAAIETEGLVDPTLGELMLAVGYDRSFDLLPDNTSPTALPSRPAHPHQPGRWRQIGIDPAGALRVPTGVALDLGATGKAFAADLVANHLAAEFGADLVVSVGGDVRVAARSDRESTGWPIQIADNATDLAAHGADVTVRLVAGGLATSSVTARRWTAAGRTFHHLLDPRTGSSARSRWRTVSALGHTCAAANVASTAAIVLGDAAPGWLTARGVAARLVGTDGDIVHTGHWTSGDTPDLDTSESRNT